MSILTHLKDYWNYHRYFYIPYKKEVAKYRNYTKEIESISRGIWQPRKSESELQNLEDSLQLLVETSRNHSFHVYDFNIQSPPIVLQYGQEHGHAVQELADMLKILSKTQMLTDQDVIFLEGFNRSFNASQFRENGKEKILYAAEGPHWVIPENHPLHNVLPLTSPIRIEGIDDADATLSILAGEMTIMQTEDLYDPRSLRMKGESIKKIISAFPKKAASYIQGYASRGKFRNRPHLMSSLDFSTNHLPRLMKESNQSYIFFARKDYNYKQQDL